MGEKLLGPNLNFKNITVALVWEIDCKGARVHMDRSVRR